jgi:hypothetical protein
MFLKTVAGCHSQHSAADLTPIAIRAAVLVTTESSKAQSVPQPNTGRVWRARFRRKYWQSSWLSKSLERLTGLGRYDAMLSSLCAGVKGSVNSAKPADCAFLAPTCRSSRMRIKLTTVLLGSQRFETLVSQSATRRPVFDSGSPASSLAENQLVSVPCTLSGTVLSQRKLLRRTRYLVTE